MTSCTSASDIWFRFKPGRPVRTKLDILMSSLQQGELKWQGHLYKHGGTGSLYTSKRLRYFRLYSHGVLNYYKKEDSKLQGTIHLQNAHLEPQVLSDDSDLKISIHTPAREYVLLTSTWEELRKWHSVIMEVISTSKDSSAFESKLMYSVPPSMLGQADEFSDEIDEDEDEKSIDEDEHVEQDEAKEDFLKKIRTDKGVSAASGGGHIVEEPNEDEHVFNDLEKNAEAREAEIFARLSDFALPDETRYIAHFKVHAGKRTTATAGKTPGKVYLFNNLLLFTSRSATSDEDANSFRLLLSAITDVRFPNYDEICAQLRDVAIGDNLFEETLPYFLPNIENSVLKKTVGSAKETSGRIRATPTNFTVVKQLEICTDDSSFIISNFLPKEGALFFNLLTDLVHIAKGDEPPSASTDTPTMAALLVNAEHEGYLSQMGTGPIRSWDASYAMLLGHTFVLAPSRLSFRPSQFFRLSDCLASRSDHLTLDRNTFAIHFIQNQSFCFRSAVPSKAEAWVEAINTEREKFSYNEFEITLDAVALSSNFELIDACKELHRHFDIQGEYLINFFRCTVNIKKSASGNRKSTLFMTPNHICLIMQGKKSAEDIEKKAFRIFQITKIAPIKTLRGVSGIEFTVGTSVVSVTGMNSTHIDLMIRLLLDLWAIARGDPGGAPSLATEPPAPTRAALQDCEKEGWLEIYGTPDGSLAATGCSWKKRWIVIYGNTLYFYKTPVDSKPRGFIILDRCMAVSAVKFSHEPHTFSLIFTNDRCYLFRDLTAPSARDWTDIINAVVPTESMTDEIRRALIETSLVESISSFMVPSEIWDLFKIPDDDLIIGIYNIGFMKKSMPTKGRICLTRRMFLFAAGGPFAYRFGVNYVDIESISLQKKSLRIKSRSTEREYHFMMSVHLSEIQKHIENLKAICEGKPPPSLPDPRKYRSIPKKLIDQQGIVFEPTAPSLVNPKYCGWMEFLKPEFFLNSDAANNWTTVWCVIHGSNTSPFGNRMYLFKSKNSSTPMLSFRLSNCFAHPSDKLLSTKKVQQWDTFGVFFFAKQSYFFRTPGCLAERFHWIARINILVPHMPQVLYRRLKKIANTSTRQDISKDLELFSLFTLPGGEQLQFLENCSFQATAGVSSKKGKLYITNNYLCFLSTGIGKVYKRSFRYSWINDIEATHARDSSKIQITYYEDPLEKFRNMSDEERKKDKAEGGEIASKLARMLGLQKDTDSIDSSKVDAADDEGTERIESMWSIESILTQYAGSLPAKDLDEQVFFLEDLKNQSDVLKQIKDVMAVTNGQPPPSIIERNGLKPTFFALEQLPSARFTRVETRVFGSHGKKTSDTEPQNFEDLYKARWITCISVLTKGMFFLFHSKWDPSPFTSMALKSVVVASAEPITGDASSFGIFSKKAKHVIIRIPKQYNQKSGGGPSCASVKQDDDIYFSSGDLKELIEQNISPKPTEEERTRILSMLVEKEDGDGARSLADQRRLVERFRRMIPQEEQIVCPPIQCCLRRATPIPGFLFITHHFVCFASLSVDPDIKEIVPLTLLDSIMASQDTSPNSQKIPKFLKDRILHISKLTDITFKDKQTARCIALKGRRPVRGMCTGTGFGVRRGTSIVDGYVDRVAVEEDEDMGSVSSDDDTVPMSIRAILPGPNGAPAPVISQSKKDGFDSQPLIEYELLLSDIEGHYSFLRLIDELSSMCKQEVPRSLLDPKIIAPIPATLEMPNFIGPIQMLSGGASQGWRKATGLLKYGILFIFKGNALVKSPSTSSGVTMTLSPSAVLSKKIDMTWVLTTDGSINTGVDNSIAIISYKFNGARIESFASSRLQWTEMSDEDRTKALEREQAKDAPEEEAGSPNAESPMTFDDAPRSIRFCPFTGKRLDDFAEVSHALESETILPPLFISFSSPEEKQMFLGATQVPFFPVPPKISSSLRQGAKFGQALEANDQWTEFEFPPEEEPLFSTISVLFGDDKIPVPGRVFVSQRYVAFSGRILSTETRAVLRVDQIQDIRTQRTKGLRPQICSIKFVGGRFPDEPRPAPKEDGFDSQLLYWEFEQRVLDKQKEAAAIREKMRAETGEAAAEGDLEFFDWTNSDFTIERMSNPDVLFSVLQDVFAAARNTIAPSLLSFYTVPASTAFTPVQHEGWLNRLASTKGGKLLWQRNWFKVYRGRLYYFANKASSPAIGSVPLEPGTPTSASDTPQKSGLLGGPGSAEASGAKSSFTRGYLSPACNFVEANPPLSADEISSQALKSVIIVTHFKAQNFYAAQDTAGPGAFGVLDQTTDLVVSCTETNIAHWYDALCAASAAARVSVDRLWRSPTLTRMNGFPLRFGGADIMRFRFSQSPGRRRRFRNSFYSLRTIKANTGFVLVQAFRGKKIIFSFFVQSLVDLEVVPPDAAAQPEPRISICFRTTSGHGTTHELIAERADQGEQWARGICEMMWH
eukprot:gnl/Chilomastix_cuspidata/2034.p1 GENE.gnl/Chilomastix_cuspidata/2034~~gnl/Chilomastix_cuspidata/2034.p1  ORF type:complete len:2431 (+),score=324.95 gnl/Chilomastix_cuspidata/2034:3598-10890(+)